MACVVLMEAISRCFNLKPDDRNLAFSTQTFSVTENIGKALIGISLIGMCLMFSKMDPGSISDLDITQKNSM